MIKLLSPMLSNTKKKIGKSSNKIFIEATQMKKKTKDPKVFMIT